MFFSKFVSFGFQDPASPIMEAIIDLHNYIMFYIVGITIFVFSMLALIVLNFYHEQKFVESLRGLKARTLLLKGNRVVHGTV
jgi:heme/copper-type cytochrome/quinol oxidase subunit 2